MTDHLSINTGGLIHVNMHHSARDRAGVSFCLPQQSQSHMNVIKFTVQLKISFSSSPNFQICLHLHVYGPEPLISRCLFSFLTVPVVLQQWFIYIRLIMQKINEILITVHYSTCSRRVILNSYQSRVLCKQLNFLIFHLYKVFSVGILFTHFPVKSHNIHSFSFASR